ncbi:LysR family transcriptional regulator [Arthrobacter mobilis]|uniref:LysR family transcriptional regulator n=1 Tax=Arthrobacter mobilis TaxID=2724944 RepID=A0A7X6HBZ3_9MICC|nr:LysR family transcriptional regulator [Arthrobacter mobilis]NKX54289.1 LysR family transcriptional regulator [Arthrobacter mobilis]
MSEFTLRQLQYFVAVLDHGSVTAAARESNISQAAASMAIAQLEHAVGVDLLIRTRSKKVVPTPAGTELAARARRILGMVGEIETAVAGGFDQMRGELRIGCMASVSPRLMPGLVEHFTRSYPAVNVTFREGGAVELQQGVLEGTLDLAFVYALQALDGLDQAEVAKVRPQLMLAAGHPLAGRESISLREVQDEPAILLDQPPTIERVTGMMRSAGIEPKLRWPSTNMETIRSLVARGLGFSFVNSRPATTVTFDDRRVAYVPVSDELPDNAIVAVLPPGVRPPRRVEEAIRFSREDAALSGAGQAPGETP